VLLHVRTLGGHALDSRVAFLIVITGDIMAMPGLSKVPSANHIRLNEAGEVEGLF